MTATPTTLLTVAMPSEARALIDHLRLTQDLSMKSFRVYKNDRIVLVVSGIGKVKSALSTGALLSNFEGAERCLAINVGIAGAHESLGANVGDLFLVNKIVDRSTRREFYPDMLVKSGLKEAQITTFDRPVKRWSVSKNFCGLVDMEASGFFEAARTFLAPHRIACLKIVSDHLDGTRLDAEFVENLIAKHERNVERFMETMLSASATGSDERGLEVARWIMAVSDSLRLTASQKKLLRDWTMTHLASGDGSLPDLAPSLLADVKTKREGKERLEKIRKILLAK